MILIKRKKKCQQCDKYERCNTRNTFKLCCFHINLLLLVMTNYRIGTSNFFLVFFSSNLRIVI